MLVIRGVALDFPRVGIDEFLLAAEEQIVLMIDRGLGAGAVFLDFLGDLVDVALSL